MLCQTFSTRNGPSTLHVQPLSFLSSSNNRVSTPPFPSDILPQEAGKKSLQLEEESEAVDTKLV